MTQHPYAHLLQTNSSQNNFPSQNERTSYSKIVQPSQRRFQNHSLSHISTDPLYQMNQHTTYNSTIVSPPANMVQPVVPPSQYIPIQQDTFINTSDSIPEPMKSLEFWNSFVQLFKKQFSSQKTAYYAQVEAMSLMKKDNETVRCFALTVQQLGKKGWCNENAAPINLKNNEIFT